MCLSCLDPLLDVIRERNPFKAKKTGKVNPSKEDDFDRDNINLPIMLQEKRSAIISDPGIPDSHKLGAEMVMTMKKVSSLALV